MPETAVCDLETGVNFDGWRRVTNVDDRVDREGWTVMRSHRQVNVEKKTRGELILSLFRLYPERQER